jgi:DNA polymerase III sliding clamp (beta) subunit (PCNA family)
MKIKLSELKTVLNHLKPGLSGNKETTEQSGSFAFSDGMAYTYNDEVSVSAPFDLGVSGAVSAKELLLLAEKLEGEEADISMDENELHIKCGKIRAGIRLDSEILMPLDQIVLNDIKWHPLPVEFKQAIKDTLFSTDKNTYTPVFSTINCKENTVESTNNERATRWTLPKTKSLDFLLNAEAAKLLVQYDKIEEWGKSEDWIHFKIEDTIFSCRTFDEKFPDLTPYFKKNGFEFEFPESILDILGRADIFIDEEFDQDKSVSIIINSKGLLRIRAEGNNGWFEETHRTRQKPEKEIQFSINPKYLQQILSYVNTAIIGEDTILFIAENFKHVVALEAAN